MISTPTSSSSSSFVAYLQQQNDCFREEYSDLAADVEPDFPWATEAFGSKPDAVNLWIGNSLSQTSFHKDHYENLYVVITGEKHFLLLPPTDLHRLYVRRYPAARYIFSPEKGGLILEMERPEREVPWCSVDPFPLSVEGMERQRDSFPLYFDGPKPLWGNKCTFFVYYELIYQSNPLEDGERDHIRRQEFLYCMRRYILLREIEDVK